jgi:Domain of unknown function (DUF3806)
MTASSLSLEKRDSGVPGLPARIAIMLINLINGAAILRCDDARSNERILMEQKIEPLSDDDAHRVEGQRTWVRDHYDPDARHQYETIEGKLRLLDTIISSGWIEPTETWKLQSLGITFGDAVAQRTGLSWVAVEDEYGRDPALHDHGTTIVVFPMTTISKRIERSEAVDVRELFDQACQSIGRLRTELKGG